MISASDEEILKRIPWWLRNALMDGSPVTIVTEDERGFIISSGENKLRGESSVTYTTYPEEVGILVTESVRSYGKFKKPV